MSLNAISWAMKQPVSRSAEKFVLVCLANYADENGYCYPSIAALESDTAQDRKTIIRGLQALAEAGWIADTGKRTGATKQIPVYQIQFENGPKNGTVPETEQSQISQVTVPFFPGNSTVFPRKGSQKRDTDPSGTVKEPSGNRERARASTRCPESFAITPEMRAWAAAETPGVDIDFQTGAMRDYTFAKAKSDWPATWRNWMRRSFEDMQKGRRPYSQGPPNGATQGKYHATIAGLTGRDRSQQQEETIDVRATEVHPRRLAGPSFR